jgi:hypothetical protein
VSDPLPWVPGAVREYLLADPGFYAMCGGRISTRPPASVTQPFVRVQAAGGFAVGGDPMLWSPLVQVDAYAPKTAQPDPEIVVWVLAAAAGRIMGRAANITYQNSSWRGRVTDGPIPDVDTSRGADTPLYVCRVRVELTMRVRPAL